MSISDNDIIGTRQLLSPRCTKCEDGVFLSISFCVNRVVGKPYYEEGIRFGNGGWNHHTVSLSAPTYFFCVVEVWGLLDVAPWLCQGGSTALGPVVLQRGSTASEAVLPWLVDSQQLHLRAPIKGGLLLH